MNKIIFIALICLTLGSCMEATPEEQANVQAQLPRDCVVRDLGNYANISHLVVVLCDKHNTTSSNYMVTQGKTQVHHTVFEIQ